MAKTKSKTEPVSKLSASLPVVLAFGIFMTALGAFAAVVENENAQAAFIVVAAAGTLLIGVVIGMALAGRSGR